MRTLTKLPGKGRLASHHASGGALGSVRSAKASPSTPSRGRTCTRYWPESVDAFRFGYGHIFFHQLSSLDGSSASGDAAVMAQLPSSLSIVHSKPKWIEWLVLSESLHSFMEVAATALNERSSRAAFGNVISKPAAHLVSTEFVSKR
jgi:hypothetical protein